MENEKSSVPCAYWFPIRTSKGKDATLLEIDYGYDFKTDTLDLSVPCPVRALAQKLGIRPKFLAARTAETYLKNFRRGLLEDHQKFVDEIEPLISLERLPKFQ